MVNKIIIDGNNYNLTESTVFPFTYEFSQAGIHNVKIGLENTNEICAYAFKNCSDLTKVTFPPIITAIKRNAFENCTKLKNIVIPEDIRYVGPSVFDGCISLQEITFTKKDSTTILTPPSTFYSDLDPITICYIPDGSKFIEISDYDNLVKDGSIQYYTKDEIGNYIAIDYELLDEEYLDNGGKYYYDQWYKIHDYLNIVEERFRNRPDSITFSYNGIPITTFEQTYASTEERTKQTYPIELGPNKITNSNYTYISSNTNLVTVNPNTGEFKIKDNVSGSATIYACTEPFYDGTYYSARLLVRIDKNPANIRIKEEYQNSSIEINEGSKFDIYSLLENEHNLELNFNIRENTRYFDIVDGHYILANNKNRNCTVNVSLPINNLYSQPSFVISFASIDANKEKPEITLGSSSVTYEYDAEKSTTIPINKPNNIELNLSYSSDNEELVTVDNTGKLTFIPNAYGTAIITIESDETETYQALVLKYTIIVKERVINNSIVIGDIILPIELPEGISNINQASEEHPIVLDLTQPIINDENEEVIIDKPTSMQLQLPAPANNQELVITQNLGGDPELILEVGYTIYETKEIDGVTYNVYEVQFGIAEYNIYYENT